MPIILTRWGGDQATEMIAAATEPKRPKVSSKRSLRPVFRAEIYARCADAAVQKSSTSDVLLSSTSEGIKSINVVTT